MKILLLEYITAGGLNHESLDTTLLSEATLMRDALLRDFCDIAGIEIVTTHDVRLVNPKNIDLGTAINADSTPHKVWQELLIDCDAALIIAPETNGILHQLTQMIEAAGVKNLGSHTHAVHIASDKFETYQILVDAGIATIPSYMASDVGKLADSMHGYVMKPNDGAGCEATYYCRDKAVLKTLLAVHGEDNFMVQPYQVGKAASISALFRQGHAWVLSCNEQMVTISEDENNIKLKACLINSLIEYFPCFQTLANQIAQAIPQLNGYVGIDVIITDKELFVVEINPRITSSYIGLRESLDYNPARLIFDMMKQTNFDLPTDLKNKPVEVQLKG